MESPWHGVVGSAFEDGVGCRYDGCSCHIAFRLARRGCDDHSRDRRFVAAGLPLSSGGRHPRPAVFVAVKRVSAGQVTGIFTACDALYFRISHVSRMGDVGLGDVCALFNVDLVIA